MPGVPDETQKIAITLKQLPIAGPSPSRLAIIVKNSIVPFKRTSACRMRSGDTQYGLVVPSFSVRAYMAQDIGNAKVVKPHPDPLRFTKARDRYSLPGQPADRAGIFDGITTDMCIAFEL